MLAAYASRKTSNKSATKANFPTVNHSNWPRCFCLKWNKGQHKHFFFNGPVGSVTSVRTVMIHPRSRANCLCWYSWIQQRSLSWADSFQLWLCWFMSVVEVLICRITLRPGHQQQQQNTAACLLTSTSKKWKPTFPSQKTFLGLSSQTLLCLSLESCGLVTNLFGPHGAVQVPLFHGTAGSEVVLAQLVGILGCEQS